MPSLVFQATETSHIYESNEPEPLNLFNQHQYDDELNYRERILQILRNDDPDNLKERMLNNQINTSRFRFKQILKFNIYFFILQTFLYFYMTKLEIM